MILDSACPLYQIETKESQVHRLYAPCEANYQRKTSRGNRVKKEGLPQPQPPRSDPRDEDRQAAERSRYLQITEATLSSVKSSSFS